MQPSRRSVLKSVGAGVASSALAGSASGECPSGSGMSVDTEYRKPAKVEEVAANHRGFLTAASQRGLLSSSEITVDETLSLDEYLRSDEGTHVWAIRHLDLTGTPFITIRQRAPAGRVTLSFAPEITGRPPIIYRKRDDSTGEIYKPDGSGGVSKRTTKHSGEKISKLTERDGVSTEGTAATFCKEGGTIDNCPSGDCFAYLGECTGSDCRLYECTGTRCCGGCCCCEDVDYCCEVCGDGCSPCDDLDPVGCISGGCSDC